MLEPETTQQNPSAPSRAAAAYCEHHDVLRYIAAQRFHVPEDDAREIIQEVFVSFLRHESRIRDDRGWLVGAVYNASRKYWRDRSDEDPLSDECDPASLTDAISRRLEIAAVLTGLAAGCREIITLRYLDGYSPEELAKRFDTTIGYAKLKLARCMRGARERLVARRARL